jgi:hypothetical protein
MKTQRYFLDRVSELSSLATRGDPWVFLCAACFIEYLAKMAYNKSTTANDYKAFLRDYFFRACPKYAAFTFASGQTDLAEQMYHVFRCGVVHSFSVFPDPQARSRGGRTRSIIFAHRNTAEGGKHLDNWVNNRRKPKLDAALFVAEDFVEDIGKVVNFLFAASRKRTTSARQLSQNIQGWNSLYPPIGSL